jgi:hypothetical protein
VKATETGIAKPLRIFVNSLQGDESSCYIFRLFFLYVPIRKISKEDLRGREDRGEGS